ncbi:MAG: hypoxanthine phosphoribosyltransferase [Ignavibacteriae bacterium]|nr:hypoxanthine phosphoribosyltransferase [Ignavibacteriota bacterium]
MQIHDHVFEKFISADEIASVVNRLAKEINDDYSGKELVIIIILKGAFIFAADIVRLLQIPNRIEFLSANSYGSSMNSSGVVEFTVPDYNFKDKHILIIEDIIDTGLTLTSITTALQKFSPASLEIVTLISKSSMRIIDIHVKYVGIEIPPIFIIGYGLDYDERGRNLPDIYSKIPSG